jgi:hypothetical protein
MNAVELYLHPNTRTWRGAQFKQHRENFTLETPKINI